MIAAEDARNVGFQFMFGSVSLPCYRKPTGDKELSRQTQAQSARSKRMFVCSRLTQIGMRSKPSLPSSQARSSSRLQDFLLGVHICPARLPSQETSMLGGTAFAPTHRLNLIQNLLLPRRSSRCMERLAGYWRLLTEQERSLLWLTSRHSRREWRSARC